MSLSSFGTSFLRQARVFCIPHNPDLLSYWDRVEDRLYKIRNCLNISGIRRQLPLFAPEIDPRLLVRARAAGLSLEDVLNSISGNLPPYRFSFLIVKAKEYAGALQAFGAALLSALEKKDAEQLARIRLEHQDEILKRSMILRDQEIAAAEASLEALKKKSITITNRRHFYEGLLERGTTVGEVAQQVAKYTSHGLMASVYPIGAGAIALKAAPSIIGFSFSTPNAGAGDALEWAANLMRMTADLSNRASELAGLEAGYERRDESWRFNLQQAEDELKEIGQQIAAAEIRIKIASKSREIHEKTIEQSQETFEFYRDKFTSLGLYTYLSTQLQRLYREAYQDALTMGRLAVRAFRFERGDDTTPLLDGSYWDASRSGLLAGERLTNALRDMERRFMETHYRCMEIDQAFSLTQIDPAALLTLKVTGECNFEVPELYFDLFYPGQYRRRIKSARLTIPCVTGPYTNVAAVLSLTGSQIRKDPELGEENLFDVPPTRSVTVATSTAQNDAGVFRLDFRDERYMPFEGAGAVNSRWTLSLPKTFRPFDYATINDVILHISYTAEYDAVFRAEIEEEGGQLEALLSTVPIFRVFSLRQEFSQGFHRLLHSPVGSTVPIELSEKHFPLFVMGRTFKLAEVSLVLEIAEERMLDDSGEALPLDLGLEIQGNTSDTRTVDLFTNDEGFGMPSFTIHSPSDEPTIFESFKPSKEPLTINVTVTSAGNFRVDNGRPSDVSALDDRKLKDIFLYFEYTAQPTH